MKTLLMFIVCLNLTDLKSQQDYRNRIIFIIDSVYADTNYLNYSLYEDSLVGVADSLLLLVNFFERDSIFKDKLFDYIIFRRNLIDTFGIAINLSDLERKLMQHSFDFFHCQRNRFRDPNTRIDSIVFYNEIELLDYTSKKSDTLFLANLFRNSSTSEQYNYSYSRLYSIMDSAQITKFYYDNISYFTKDTFSYFQILKKAKKEKRPYPFTSITENQFISMYDTLNMDNKRYYYYLIKDDKRLLDAYEDSVYQADKALRDSIFNENIRQKELEQEEYYRVNDSINVATIYDRFEPYWKNAYSDTTLWNGNGTVPVLEVDDGMRFDTLSNAEIFTKLSLINFHEVYDTAQSMWSLNHKVVTIHLRKIFQILGDRCAYGLFVPDSIQRIVLDQWIDDYYFMACNDTLLFKKSEAGEQLIRMWKLLYPKFKNWIPMDKKCRFGMMDVSPNLRKMVNEIMILEIISDGDLAFFNGDSAKVEAIGNFIASVWNEVDILQNQRLPRRPVRTAIETLKWVDDYIYPALVRWNHPTSWKK